jgi:hypothetical protein
MAWKAPAAAAVAAAVVLAVTASAPAAVIHARAVSTLASGSPPVNLAEYRACVGAAYSAASPVSALLAGYSDVSKVGNAAQVGFPNPALADSPASGGLTSAEPVFHGDVLECERITLQLDYHGQREMPPVTATFLGFRFVPVTATAILTQAGPAPLTTLIIDNLGPLDSPDTADPFTAVSLARVDLRLTDVRVNGVALNVGSSCRTDAPLFTPGNPEAPGELVLTGGTNLGDPSPSFGNAIAGGTVAGQADIPPFTGCVTPSGENLDALLTATVSGPGNYVRIVSGELCPFAAPCKGGQQPPPQLAPLWTVAHGGPYTASGPLTLVGENGSITITCPRSVISGDFPDVTGPLRGGLASVRWSKIGGCTGSDGSTWRITQPESAFLGPKIAGLAGPGVTTSNIDDLALTMAGTGTGAPGTCQVTVTGYAGQMTYANSGSVLASPAVPNATLHILHSSCPDAPADSSTNAFGDFYLSATYRLKPGGMTVTEP